MLVIIFPFFGNSQLDYNTLTQTRFNGQVKKVISETICYDQRQDTVIEVRCFDENAQLEYSIYRLLDYNDSVEYVITNDTLREMHFYNLNEENVYYPVYRKVFYHDNFRDSLKVHSELHNFDKSRIYNTEERIYVNHHQIYYKKNELGLGHVEEQYLKRDVNNKLTQLTILDNLDSLYQTVHSVNSYGYVVSTNKYFKNGDIDTEVFDYKYRFKKGLIIHSSRNQDGMLVRNKYDKHRNNISSEIKMNGNIIETMKRSFYY